MTSLTLAGNSRTNNICEGWIIAFVKLVYHVHSTIWKVTDSLRNCLAQQTTHTHPAGGIAPNEVITRSEFEVHLKLLRSECNEGCDWCIYVTVVTCAVTLTSTLGIQ